MEEHILKLLGRPDYVPANVPELLRHLRLSPGRQQELQRALHGLEQSGQIARIKGNRYIQPHAADLVPGRIGSTVKAKVFSSRTMPGLTRDHDPGRSHGHRAARGSRAGAAGCQGERIAARPSEQQTGAVVRILERKRTQIVGTLQRGREFLYVIPDDPRIPHDIYVPPPRDVGRPANVGDKVVVELREWKSRHTNPEGEIIEVLGAPDEEGVDMLSVLRQYNLPLHFPKNVLQEARAIGTTVRTARTGRPRGLPAAPGRHD